MPFCSVCQKAQPAGDPEGGMLCPDCGTKMTGERPLEPGTGINGFTIVQELGRGGMGTVYLAKQDSLGRFVALKVLDESLTKDAKYVEGFFREARAAASLNHPNIVQAYDAGIADSGVYYFVMELIDGEDLDRYITKHGKLETLMGVRIALKICGALEYANEHHLCHGDIKPENIILKNNGEPKLADLGLARDYRKDKLNPGEIMATPAYAPPEIIRGELEKIDFKSDMYSFGATLYHLFSGSPPFPGDDPVQVCTMQLNNQPKPLCAVNTSVPHLLSELVDKLMEKAPANRPESWHCVSAVLASVEEELCPGSSDGILPEPVAEKSRKLILAGTALFLCLLLAAAGFVIWKVKAGKQRRTTVQTVVIENYDPVSQEILTDRTRHSEAKAKWSILQNQLTSMTSQQAYDHVLQYKKTYEKYAVADAEKKLTELKERLLFEKQYAEFQAAKNKVEQAIASSKILKDGSTKDLQHLQQQIRTCLRMADKLYPATARFNPSALPLITQKRRIDYEKYIERLAGKQKEITTTIRKQQEEQRERNRRYHEQQKDSVRAFTQLEKEFRNGPSSLKEAKKLLNSFNEWEQQYASVLTEKQKKKLAMIRSLLPAIAMSDAEFLHSIRHVLEGYAILPKCHFVDADEKGIRCIVAGQKARVEKRLLWENFADRKGSFRTLSAAVCTDPAILDKLTREEQIALFQIAVSEKRPLPGYYRNLIQRCRSIPENEARLLEEAAAYFLNQ